MRKRSTAERLAAAALEILLDEGAQAVTMRRVAAAVGVTAMTTYRHYANREALLRSVADAAFESLGKAWGERSAALDFDSRLDGLTDDFLDFALGKPHLYTFLVTERRTGALRFPEDFREGGSPAFIPILEAVKQGMREGALRSADPLEVALAIITPAIGLVQLYLGGRFHLSEPDLRALCKRTIGRILDGLRG